MPELPHDDETEVLDLVSSWLGRSSNTILYSDTVLDIKEAIVHEVEQRGGFDFISIHPDRVCARRGTEFLAVISTCLTTRPDLQELLERG